VTEGTNSRILNRRQAIAAGAMMVGRLCGVTSLLFEGQAKAAEAVAMKSFAIPDGAIDSHVHVFSPVRFPYSNSSTYTPGEANLQDLNALRARLRISRLVLVQPSVYGTDNRCMLDAVAQLGPEVARSIAVIDATSITDLQLHELQRLGVVGVRANLSVKRDIDGPRAISEISQLLARVADFGLGLQVYVALSMIDTLAEAIADARVPIVLDHFAGAQARLGLDQPGFAALRQLLASGKVWIKLSAPYRASQQGPDFPDVIPLARALIDANPEHLVWGSDWPHTGGGARRGDSTANDIEPFLSVDDSRCLDLLSTWAGDRAVHRKILVENPERLYRFQSKRFTS
jgi:predicted TIM-barrel fold metal-dependent hydrolase